MTPFFLISCSHSISAPLCLYHLYTQSLSVTLSTFSVSLSHSVNPPLSLYVLTLCSWCSPLSELMAPYSSWSRCKYEHSAPKQRRGGSKHPTVVTFCTEDFVQWSGHWIANPGYSELTTTGVKLCSILVKRTGNRVGLRTQTKKTQKHNENTTVEWKSLPLKCPRKMSVHESRFSCCWWHVYSSTLSSPLRLLLSEDSLCWWSTRSASTGRRNVTVISFTKIHFMAPGISVARMHQRNHVLFSFAVSHSPHPVSTAWD